MIAIFRYILFLLLLLPLQMFGSGASRSAQWGACGDSLYHSVDRAKFIGRDYLGEVAGQMRAAIGERAFLSNADAYVAMMAMDYEKARALYDRVIAVADDEFDRLEANVGMMRLCHRVSANREFYDYRARKQPATSHDNVGGRGW